MNETLRYLSRHNIWATKALLETCRTLTPERLSAPGTAAYGSIIETFDHLVSSDAGYLRSLGGPKTANEEREPVGLDELALRVDDIERLWNSFFSKEEFDSGRIRVLDLGTYECPAGIVMAQVFHHGSVHREQICAMLTHLGVEPPDIQPWAFADATGISRFLGGRTS